MSKALEYFSNAKTRKEVEMIGVSLLVHEKGGVLKAMTEWSFYNQDATPKQRYDMKKMLSTARETYPLTKSKLLK